MRAVLCALLVATSAADDTDEIAKLTKDLKSKDAKVRLKAVEKLSGLGEDAAQPLCDAMLDPNAKVAQAALSGLEKAHPKLYRPLSVVVLDSNKSRRQLALSEIEKLGVSARPATNLLISRYKSEITREPLPRPSPSTNPRREPTHTEAPEYLRAITHAGGDSEEYLKFLKATCVTPYPWARHEALRGLVTWAGEDEGRKKELLPVIKANLIDHHDAVPFIQAAGRCGKLSKDFLPVLKKLKLSNDAKVRDASTAAVGAIEAP